MYLVDTNVLSVAAPVKTPFMPDLAAWMERHSQRLYLSAITVAEIERGIAKLRRDGVHAKADRYAAWLEAVLHLYAARILPLDIPVARLLGQLSDRARSTGQDPGLADLAIAATAQHHGYVILTRNLRHFRPLGVSAHDPYASLPLASPLPPA